MVLPYVFPNFLLKDVNHSNTMNHPCSYEISQRQLVRIQPIVSRPSWVGSSWKVGRSTSQGYAQSTRCEKM